MVYKPNTRRENIMDKTPQVELLPMVVLFEHDTPTVRADPFDAARRSTNPRDRQALAEFFNQSTP